MSNSATVSVVLCGFQESSGLLGRLVVGMVGLAWSLITFLVLPVVVIEGLGVGAAIKRSSELFKRAWGEQMIANAGIGLVGGVASLCGIPLLLLAATGSPTLAVVGIVLFAVWVGAVVCVTSALSVVFQTALYHYASSGSAPAAFAGAELANAFVPGRRGMRPPFMR